MGTWDAEYDGSWVPFVVPWSGEVLVPEAPPTPDFPIPAPPIPHLGNPVPVIVHGIEYAWSDVSSWVEDAWHGVTSFFTGGFSVTADIVKNIIDVAQHYEQTAWASFIGQLEAWINAIVAEATSSIEGLTTYSISEAVHLRGYVNTVRDDILRRLLEDVTGIDGKITALEGRVIGGIDTTTNNIKTWAIDNIYDPLSTDVENLKGAVLGGIPQILDEAATTAQSLVDSEALKRAAAIASLAGAVALLEKFVNDCGAPMCEAYGPNTDFSKLLKLLDLAGMLAALVALGGLTESDVQQLAQSIVATATGDAEAFVRLFVNEGNTLAGAIANTLPEIGF